MNKKVCAGKCSHEMHLVSKSRFFAFYQCDLKRCFCFHAGNKAVHLSMPQLLALRRDVEEIDLSTHFYPDENPSGIEILLFANLDHVLILDTYQVIDLKRLMEQTFEILTGSVEKMVAA